MLREILLLFITTILFLFFYYFLVFLWDVGSVPLPDVIVSPQGGVFVHNPPYLGTAKVTRSRCDGGLMSISVFPTVGISNYHCYSNDTVHVRISALVGSRDVM